MKTKLFVMSGDQEVAVLENEQLTIIDEQLVPLFLKRTHAFIQWVADRAIDAVRPNSRILKKAHGISRLASDYETAMLYNAACITDNFWVRKDESECWDEIKFNSDLYFRAALSSDNTVFSRKPSRTPELTSAGSREKGWKLEEGTWWLYKNEPAQNQRFERLTYELGDLLGFDMAYYELKDGFIRTRDLTEGKYNLQHIDALVYDHDGVTDDDMAYNYEVLYSLDQQILPDTHRSLAQQFLDIKYLDALVNNVDRHTKNYGLLTSREDGHIIRMAPNYDNDMAFYGYPDILSRDRNAGEIRAVIRSGVMKHYEPPKIDEDELADMLNGYEKGELLREYILKGQELIADSK